MQVQPYLFFDGRCDEALEFYQRALGAEVTMRMRFKDSPDPGACPSNAEDKVMHASFRVGDTTVLASDGRCQGQPSFEGFALSLAVSDEAAAERLFACSCRRRAGPGAARQDLLFRALWHGRRPLRRALDGLRRAVRDRARSRRRERAPMRVVPRIGRIRRTRDQKKEI